MCSPRGETCIEFGPDVTARFCHQNGIKMIVRAHQFVDHGWKVNMRLRREQQCRRLESGRGREGGREGGREEKENMCVPACL